MTLDELLATYPPDDIALGKVTVEVLDPPTCEWRTFIPRFKAGHTCWFGLTSDGDCTKKFAGADARPLPKPRRKLWQWLRYIETNKEYYPTNRFYPTREEAEAHYNPVYGRIIKRLDHTEIEVDDNP